MRNFRKQDRLNRYILFILISVNVTCFYACTGGRGESKGTNASDSITVISIRIPDHPLTIDTMIYGEMLENCNDQIIYDGIVNKDGSERHAVNRLIKPLHIPVIRWPGGTYSLEYHWENAIGPINKRPVTENHAWGGKDNNRFGTDEFIQWCNEMGAAPYINLNMGNKPPYAGTLKEALNWIEYANGTVETDYGKKRFKNGHPSPYHVKYWGIGNENYGPWGMHQKEGANVYSGKLFQWADTIRSHYPDLQLLGVGHTYVWDSIVLNSCGSLIDYLTQHYYVTSKFRDQKVEDPEQSLFAPEKMEAHLQSVNKLIKEANKRFNREDNPIKLSVDEWDNRHNVFNGTKYEFTRQDPRYQFDVAVIAGMLNVFIRQSPTVGMANYLFPVNGHGLIRTVGDSDAFRSSIYYVFKQYKNWMTGEKLDATTNGPGISASDFNLYLDGDANENNLKEVSFAYVDVSAVRGNDGKITVALVNRDARNKRKISLNVPKGYIAATKWALESKDINASNTVENRNEVQPVEEKIKNGSNSVEVSIYPCGLYLVRFDKKKQR